MNVKEEFQTLLMQIAGAITDEQLAEFILQLTDGRIAEAYDALTATFTTAEHVAALQLLADDFRQLNQQNVSMIAMQRQFITRLLFAALTSVKLFAAESRDKPIVPPDAVSA